LPIVQRYVPHQGGSFTLPGRVGNVNPTRKGVVPGTLRQSDVICLCCRWYGPRRLFVPYARRGTQNCACR
jgi:hypothetical protein